MQISRKKFAQFIFFHYLCSRFCTCIDIAFSYYSPLGCYPCPLRHNMPAAVAPCSISSICPLLAVSMPSAAPTLASATAMCLCPCVTPPCWANAPTKCYNSTSLTTCPVQCSDPSSMDTISEIFSRLARTLPANPTTLPSESTTSTTDICPMPITKETRQEDPSGPKIYSSTPSMHDN